MIRKKGDTNRDLAKTLADQNEEENEEKTYLPIRDTYTWDLYRPSHFVST